MNLETVIITNNHVFSIRYWQHDLFRTRVRPVLRTRTGDEVSQRPVSAYASHANGIHFYSDVLYIP